MESGRGPELRIYRNILYFNSNRSNFDIQEDWSIFRFPLISYIFS